MLDAFLPHLDRLFFGKKLPYLNLDCLKDEEASSIDLGPRTYLYSQFLRGEWRKNSVLTSLELWSKPLQKLIFYNFLGFLFLIC